jgi:hypothetical protein
MLPKAFFDKTVLVKFKISYNLEQNIDEIHTLGYGFKNL